MIKKNIRLSLLLIFSGYLLYAQDVEDKSTTKQIWLDYNPAFSLSEKVDVYGDIGARTVFPNEWYRFVFYDSIARVATLADKGQINIIQIKNH